MTNFWLVRKTNKLSIEFTSDLSYTIDNVTVLFELRQLSYKKTVFKTSGQLIQVYYTFDDLGTAYIQLLTQKKLSHRNMEKGLVVMNFNLKRFVAAFVIL